MTIKVRILIAAVLICGLLMIINMLRKLENCQIEICPRVAAKVILYCWFYGGAVDLR